MNRNYHHRILLIGWLFCAVTILYIFLCMLLPAPLELPFLMLSCVLTVPLTMEFNVKGIVAQIVVVTLFVTLRFGFSVAAPYLLFLGYYPPVKFLCEQRGSISGLATKLMIYCFAFGLMMRLFPSPLFTAYAQLPWFVLLLLFLALFGLADVAVSIFAAAYNNIFRRKLL